MGWEVSAAERRADLREAAYKMDMADKAEHSRVENRLVQQGDACLTIAHVKSIGLALERRESKGK